MLFHNIVHLPVDLVDGISDCGVAMTIFEKSVAVLASQKPPTFEREDWSLFRTIEGLQQRAGVPKRLLPRLVLKEIPS